MDDRVLPYNLDVEKALLGVCLCGDEVILDTVMMLVRVEHFYAGPHRTIFDAIANLHKAGMPVDQVSVLDEVQKGKGDHAPLAVTIAEAISHTVGTVKNAEHYARLVVRDYQRRSLIVGAQKLMESAYNNAEELEDVLAQASNLSENASVCDFNQWVSIGDGAREALDALEKAWQNPGQMTGITTGIEDLDNILDGFQSSDLVIVGARPGCGKTSLGVFAANAAANIGAPVGFVSIEMSARQIGGRFVSLGSMVDSYTLRKGNLHQSEYQALSDAEQAIKVLPIIVMDKVSDLDAIVNHTRMLKRKRGIGLLIVDYLQLVRGHREKNDNREREVANISWTLKMLAKDLDIPVVVLAQLNRALSQRPDKRPQLFDLRESGALEQDADVVIFLHRPILYGKTVEEMPQGEKVDVKNMAEIIVAKHRNGPVGTVRAFVDMSTGYWGKWNMENHLIT